MSDDFVLPDGSRFDTNVGLDETLPARKFRGYGILLKKTKDRLSRYGMKPRRLEAVASIRQEVGDDEIGVDSRPELAAAELSVYSMMGVEISEEDTSLNPRFGNFAEDLVMVPDGYEQTYRFARQTSNYRNMAFLDVPKLRLAIDIRPGRMSHSATNDGKAGILGSRLAWLPRDSPVRTTMEVFNLYQDINLGLIRDDKFAYLPTALGGYGKPVPFSHAPNFEAFCIRYKQGTHSGLARELVRRSNRRFDEYTIENRYNTDPVLSAVSRLQSSWHDWIKGKSLYAPTCWLDAPPEVAAYRVKKHGEDVRVDAVLRRLQASGHLVTESDLAIAYEHNLLCKSLLSTETHTQFLEKREESRKSWREGSTFSLRLYGLIQPLLVDQSMHGPLRILEYERFWLSITKKKLHLRSFLRQENFYDKRAKDAVYMNGPMMVHMALQPIVTQMRRRYWFEPQTDRLDELETNEEFELLLNWVKGDTENTNPPSRKIIDDDPFIIKQMSLGPPEQSYCIVTDDIRLCRDAYASTKRWVIRVPVKWYYMSVYYGSTPEPWLQKAQYRFPMHSWETIIDEGSVESYEEIGFRDGLPIKWPSERPLILTRPSFNTETLVRIRKQRTFPDQEDNPDWEPYRFPDGHIFGPASFLQRNKHPFKRGWA